MSTRVYLLEDHTIVRQGLVALLDTAEDIEVVGESGDGRRALEEVESLAPDVLVSDIAVPGLSGLEVVKRLRAGGSRVRVVMLSMYHDPEWVKRAMDAGANGYLIKGTGVRDLLKAVRTVAKGETFLSPSATRAARTEELTGREREVLTLLAEGHTSKEIGGVLGISSRTVEHHRARLMTKLGINDVAGLTRYAVRTGLVDLNLK